ncbi:substrate-binding domain-containing protein [Nocardia crassostreae]|uniref:substrate-binding domain-containing protein n=1 Tax=Nocardia crassostreae TaxID=53428 RepID=UPI001FDFAA37|nr:substrate-binding domain-containing protein [Nocardia crassostreae]
MSIEIVLALIGIAVPLIAFLWEFVLVGRKRLGYRVQMDTPVTGRIEDPTDSVDVLPGVLGQLRTPATDGSAPELHDLSIVLIRIENNGATAVDTRDYAVPDEQHIGLHLHFPDRRVLGMAVTEFSPRGLADSLRPGSGIGAHEETVDGKRIGVLDLPKVPMNRGDHYKILVLFERTTGAGKYAAPTVEGGLKGGRVTETRSRTGSSPALLGLIAFLVAVIAIQFAVAVTDKPVRAGCATGTLALVGSTAFEPVMTEAADAYEKVCPGATIVTEFAGSESGLDRVDKQPLGDAGLLAITDGPKTVAFPNARLLPRSLAMSVFTMIVHPQVTVANLTVAQIRDLYAGRIGNWQQLGGPDLAVRVVDRALGSGTRETFLRRILGGEQPPAPPATCRTIQVTNPPGHASCSVQYTKDMLETIATLPGALGYSEATDAEKASGITRVTIDGAPATREALLDNGYPFWNVEYAYSHGELPDDSVAASFLRFVTEQEGKDILRKYGNKPCTELRDPTGCGP